jgi:nucleoid DNA-binding protein
VVVLTKKEIGTKVALKTGITHKKAVAIIDQMLSEIKNSLARGEKIEIRGFGVFKIRNSKAKIARNLKTNSEILIAPTRRVKFVPGKKMKEQVNEGD